MRRVEHVYTQLSVSALAGRLVQTCSVIHSIPIDPRSAFIIITKRALVCPDILCAQEYLKSYVIRGRNFTRSKLQSQRTLELDKLTSSA
jgi:hypothetical protein